MRFGKGDESTAQLGEFNILTRLSLTICEYSFSLHLFRSFFKIINFILIPLF